MPPPSFKPPTPILTFRTIPSAPLPPSYSTSETSQPPSYSTPSNPPPPLPTYTAENDATSSSSSSYSPDPQDPEEKQPYYLLAQIQENMTITKPTFILRDLAGTTFALVWSDLSRDSLDFKTLGLKKGNCLLLVNATSTEPPPPQLLPGGGQEAAKQACVKLYGSDPGSFFNDDDDDRHHEVRVKVIPGPLEKVVEVGQFWDELGDESRCAGCGRGGQEEDQKEKGELPSLVLKKCTGCARVGYCSKECQFKGWTEGGHKSLCKIIKRFNEIWP